MRYASILPPILLLFGLLTIYILIRCLMRSYYRLKKRHSPSTQNFLRSPGQSLGSEIDCLNQEISFSFAVLTAFPLLFYSGFLSWLYFADRQFKPEDVALWVILGSVFIIYLLFKTLKIFKKKRSLRLGYEGAVSVGQELNQLMLEGYHVYHDFPAEKFNIDHIVVGRTGIFTVETNARPKFTANSRRDDATVEYNGKILMFPNGDDLEIIDQAERQSSWLSQWISSAIGDQIAARAIVALPGWLVKRTSADGISVVNPNQFSSLFKHITPRTLTDEMIAQIVHQLEQKYRDVTPGV